MFKITLNGYDTDIVNVPFKEALAELDKGFSKASSLVLQGLYQSVNYDRQDFTLIVSDGMKNTYQIVEMEN